jgi:hypothetical protein
MSDESKDASVAKSKGIDVATAARERLVAERGPFYARKVAFMVAMKVSLHTMPDAHAKHSALTLMGNDVMMDLMERFGKETNLLGFMADCERLMEELTGAMDKSDVS